MTERQKRFAEEYLIDLNATRAYKAAYTNVKKDEVAAVNASKLLRNTKVKAYIEEKMQERSERTEVTQDKVVNELAKIGFTKTVLFNELEIKTSDKIKALELLGRHLGMFDDKISVTSTISNPFEGLTTEQLIKLAGDRSAKR